MDEPRLQSEVLVFLSSLNPSSKDTIPERRLRLTSSTPTVPIGRTSKRKSSLEASPTNAYFDCPVMSRYHAELKLDTDKDNKHKVYLVDNGSLHGTRLNRLPISKDQSQLLKTDDIVTFGTPIDRGAEKFIPYEVQARIVCGTSMPDDKPVIYRVPDETDVEDISSDDDDGLAYGRDLLRKHDIRPSQRAPIDLTSEVDATVDSHKMRPRADPLLHPSTGPQSPYVDLTSSMENPPAKGSTNLITEHLLARHSPVKTTEDLDDRNHVWASESDGDFGMEDRDSDEEPGIEDTTCSDPPEHQSPSFASNLAEAGVPGLDFLTDEEEEEDEEDLEIDDEVDDNDESDDDPGFTYFNTDSEGSSPDDGETAADHTGTTAATSVPSIAKTSPCTAHVKSEWPTLEFAEEPAPSQPCPDMRGHLEYILDANRGQTEQSGGDTSVAPRLIQPPRFMPATLQGEQNQFALHPTNAGRAIHPMTDTANFQSSKPDKAEFFKAREENRRNISAGGPFAPTRVDPLTSLSLVSSSPLTQPFPSDMNFNPTAGDTNGLLESGNQFLHAPLDDTLPRIPARVESPPLDDTSAHLFEMSKKAVPVTNTENTDSRRVVDIRDIIDHPPLTAKSWSPPKRKAEDISQSTPSEEEVVKITRPNVAAPNSTTCLQPEVQDAPQFPRASHAIAESDSNSQPPTKRLRRAAEVFGYAALGGIAVMSALIATAPAL